MWQYHIDLEKQIALELDVTTSTNLSSESIGRYCINKSKLKPKEQNQHRCPSAGIEALWILYHHVSSGFCIPELKRPRIDPLGSLL